MLYKGIFIYCCSDIFLSGSHKLCRSQSRRHPWEKTSVYMESWGHCEECVALTMWSLKIHSRICLFQNTGKETISSVLYCQDKVHFKDKTAITINLIPLDTFFFIISHYDISSLHKRLYLTRHIALYLLVA